MDERQRRQRWQPGGYILAFFLLFMILVISVQTLTQRLAQDYIISEVTVPPATFPMEEPTLDNPIDTAAALPDTLTQDDAMPEDAA